MDMLAKDFISLLPIILIFWLISSYLVVRRPISVILPRTSFIRI